MLRKIGFAASIVRRGLAPAALLMAAVFAIGLGSTVARSESGGTGPTGPDVPKIAVQPPANQPAGGQPPGYRLGSGDRVRVTVFGQPDLTGEYLVDGSGTLSFPLIGQVRAGGSTADQLGQLITSRLKPDYLKDPKVSVEVLTYRPFYIVGEVKTPGSYAYVSGMTVINAVALAGGFTYRAREDSFYVTHTDKDGKKVRGAATPDTAVEPGDVVTVRERYF